ncbi:tetratricopeptide repeat protein, partial [Brachyspira pilosicoli]|uniref:tetratricopeptide repeat protein n=1 Tax=Brachyspira pilosicoli TaxID=52584 RepID=UPI001CA5F297
MDNTNNNTNDKPNNKYNSKHKNNTCIMIILFLLALGAFAVIYSVHAIFIDNRFNKALENYSLNIQTIMSNTTIDKTVITNESGNSITINNEFIINDEIANSFKSTFDINTRMLESSMSEIMKNSNDLLSFWFAFLSVIMIVFTFASIFINNNILSESKENLKYINDLKKDIENYKEKIHNYELSIKNLQLKIDTETQRKISELEKNSNQFLREINEKNSEALNSIDKLKIEFNNSINLIQEKSNQMILDIKEQAQTESKQLIEENNINIQISNLFNLAYQSYNNKDYNLCIDYYNKIIEMTDNLLKGYDKNSEKYSKYKNNYFIAYNNRGIAKAKSGDNKVAIEDFDKAIQLNSNSAESYNNIGTAKNNLGLYEEAIKDFDKAIELDSNYLSAYNNRGISKA